MHCQIQSIQQGKEFLVKQRFESSMKQSLAELLQVSKADRSRADFLLGFQLLERQRGQCAPVANQCPNLESFATIS